MLKFLQKLKLYTKLGLETAHEVFTLEFISDYLQITIINKSIFTTAKPHWTSSVRSMSGVILSGNGPGTIKCSHFAYHYFVHFERLYITQKVMCQWSCPSQFSINFLVAKWASVHKKWSFPLRISSVDVSKSAVSCEFGHIYLRNP